MSDLTVVAVIRSKPESADLVRGAMTELVAPTRSEPGCVSYDLYESSSAPGTFITVETWKDKSDLDAHMQTEHIAHVFATAGHGLAGDPEIHPLSPIVVG